MAYIATPFMLLTLNTRLQSRKKDKYIVNFEAKHSTDQKTLKLYTEAIKSFRLLYDGAEWISIVTKYICQYLDIRYPPPTSTDQEDWTNILLLRPHLYLRLTLTMDLAIRNCRLPCESDFPSCLQFSFEDPLTSSNVIPQDYSVAINTESANSSANSAAITSLEKLQNVADENNEPGQDTEPVTVGLSREANLAARNTINIWDFGNGDEVSSWSAMAVDLNMDFLDTPSLYS